MHARTFKGVGICKDLRFERLGNLEDLSQVRRLAGGIGVIDSERHLAANGTEIGTLGAAVEADATAAGRGVDLVHGLSSGVFDGKGRDAIVAVLHNVPELMAFSRRKGGRLVAAALAGTNGTTDERTVDRQQLRVGAFFVDAHYKGMDGTARKKKERKSVTEG